VSSSKNAPVLAAVLVTILAWASAFIGIRAVRDDLSPGALALGRLLVGTLILGLLLLRRGWVRPTGREWGLLAVCGVGWFAVYNVALNAAEHHLDAGTTAMLVNIGPILIAVFAGLFLGEGFPRWLVIGIVVAFAGVVIIGLATRSGGADLTGVLLTDKTTLVDDLKTALATPGPEKQPGEQDRGRRQVEQQKHERCALHRRPPREDQGQVPHRPHDAEEQAGQQWAHGQR